MAKFEIGEIAVIIKDLSGNLPHVIGADVEIITGPPSDEYIYDYVTKDGDGNIWYCIESELRKKKPPKEELSTWEAIQKLTDWNPKKVSV